MSAWLGRPHLIDQKDLSFVFPNLRLDQCPTQPNLLSPFAHIALQAHLARRVVPLMGDIQVISQLSAEQVIAVQEECQTFIEDLPPVFKMDDPDLSLDIEHPYYVFQRFQLHAVIYMTMLDFLKPYLSRDPKNPKTPYDEELRKTGVELGLKLLEVARLVFDHEFPINAKFHMVVFCIFDTATILCSAIIHDTEHVLPHRDRVMDAVESALDMLHQLSLTTKIGASSYHFLFKLVQAAPVLSRYSPIRKRQRRETSISPPDPTTPAVAQAAPAYIVPQAEPSTKVATTAMDPVPIMPTTDDLSFDLDQFLAQNPFGGSSSAALDMGGMEVIWDWEELNLDQFGHPDPPA